MNKNEIQKVRWEKLRAKGKEKFLIYDGIIGWGIPTALFFTLITTFIDNDYSIKLDKDFLETLIISIALFPIGGYFWGYGYGKVQKNATIKTNFNYGLSCQCITGVRFRLEMRVIFLFNRIRRDLSYYLKEHQNRNNRILHYFAFLSAYISWILLFIDLRVTLILALIHYLLSWIGHFYFEGNKPASFRYPHVGFYAGFIWFFIKTIEIITRKEILNPWINKTRLKRE